MYVMYPKTRGDVIFEEVEPATDARKVKNTGDNLLESVE